MEIKKFKVEDFVGENMAFRVQPKDALPMYLVTNEKIKKHLDNGQRRIYTLQEIGELMKLQPEVHVAEAVKEVFGERAKVTEVIEYG